MVVELTEVVTYQIVVSDDSEDPHEEAEYIYCQSENPWNDFPAEINERVTQVQK